MKTCWECGGEFKVIKGKIYHYKESGLDNVYLDGIIQYKCPKCGEGGPEIPNIAELHLLIGGTLVCKGEPLKGPEIIYLRKEIGVKSKDMAELLAVTPQAYSRWENSKEIISSVYDRYLRMLYILNVGYKTGKILHEGINFVRHIASRKPIKRASRVKNRITISASEWIMPFTEPLFTEACIR